MNLIGSITIDVLFLQVLRVCYDRYQALMVILYILALAGLL